MGAGKERGGRKREKTKGQRCKQRYKFRGRESHEMDRREKAKGGGGWGAARRRSAEIRNAEKEVAVGAADARLQLTAWSHSPHPRVYRGFLLGEWELEIEN